MKTIGKVVCGIMAIQIVSSLSIFSAEAIAPHTLQRQLQKFHENPRLEMDRRLPKRNSSNEQVSLPMEETVHQAARLSADEIFYLKDLIRRQICERSGSECEGPHENALYSLILDHERPEDLLDASHPLRNLSEIEAQNLRTGKAKAPPWSGSYWPMSKGLIAARYADAKYPHSTKWYENYQYILNAPPQLLSTNHNQDILNSLSPAEKYDLLLGDPDFTLSQKMWDSGMKEYKGSCKNQDETSCQVLQWEGLCHGWAAASFSCAEPKNKVILTGASGVPITFYPSDIKALQSLLYAYAPPPKKFIGRRCQVKDPLKDEVGRVIDPNCNDINPATFHIVLVNQVGLLGESFVMDATYDQEVWNYPVEDYRSVYFNPQTLEIEKNMAAAVIPIETYSIDKFKQRAPGTTHVIGVATDVTYTIPTVPTTGEGVPRRTHTVTYVYDLELDATSNIIGGEWYTNLHPDFLWRPNTGTKPITVGDRRLPEAVTWDGQGPIPSEWYEPALTSSRARVPLAKIVETLSQLSASH